MKKYLFFFSLCIFCTKIFAQNFQWAKKLGGAGANDYGGSVSVDPAGNVYTTGYFQESVDFDPGPGVHILNATGGQGAVNIFISKLDANGNFVWAKSFGSDVAWDDRGLSIAIDASGNIFTLGFFKDTIDFDPGPGVYNLIAPPTSNSTSSAFFLLKLDVDGNFIWARASNDPITLGYALKLDTQGNCYITGSIIAQNADLDPGPAVYNINFPNGFGAFILKLNSSGDFVWAQGLSATGFFIGSNIDLDPAGNIYITGGFNGVADLDPGSGVYNLTSAGYYDIFIAKFDGSGNLLWAHSIGNTNLDYSHSFCVDNGGNVFATGQFALTADFDPGPGIYNLTSAGSDDIFILKLNTNGDFVWAKNIGGIGSDVGLSIIFDKENHICTTGGFSGIVDFDPGTGISNLNSSGMNDIYIATYDTTGNFLNAVSFGGTDNDFAADLAVDAQNNIFVTGGFNGTADFDPGVGLSDISSDGGVDIFILKLSQSSVPISLLNFDVTKNKNDADLTWQTATESNTSKFEIESSDDGNLFIKIGEVNASVFSNSIKRYHFIDHNAALNFPGKNIYYRFKQIDLDGKFTFSPVRSIKFETVVIINIYPNPASDFIAIETNIGQPGLNYIITDETGRLVLHGKLKSANSIINISKLSKGIYFVHIDKQKNAIKLIKQ